MKTAPADYQPRDILFLEMISDDREVWVYRDWRDWSMMTFSPDPDSDLEASDQARAYAAAEGLKYLI